MLLLVSFIPTEMKESMKRDMTLCKFSLRKCKRERERKEREREKTKTKKK